MSTPAVNAERLLAVVNGDWSAYEQRQTFQTFGENSRTIESVDYDWGLLRHDIHVLAHHATAVKH